MLPRDFPSLLNFMKFFRLNAVLLRQQVQSVRAGLPEPQINQDFSKGATIMKVALERATSFSAETMSTSTR